LANGHIQIGRGVAVNMAFGQMLVVRYLPVSSVPLLQCGQK